MGDSSATWESTLSLLARARAGDESALDALFARYGPPLRRWARGRLPRWARDLADTPDLVQDSLLQTFRHLDGFDCRGEGALQAYLRQVVMNRIRDELRKAQTRPAFTEVGLEMRDDGPSPLEAAIGSEAIERYETALDRLRPEERELVIARVELGLTYSEIAAAAAKPSPNAARMAVARALLRLAEEMGEGERAPD